MFNTYAPSVASRLATTSPLAVDASYTILDGMLDISVDVAVDAATSGAGRTVRFFVASEDEHGHLNMVRAVLTPEPFTLTTPGQSVTVTRSVPMAAGWEETNLNVVVMVQSSLTGEVFQAAQAIPDYAGQIVIDCDPDGIDAAWDITGPGLARSGRGDAVLNVFATGLYELSWEDVAYWNSPAGLQQQTLIQDGTATFTGTYSDGPFVAITSAPFGDTGAGAAISLVDIDGDGNLDVHMTSDGATDRLLRGDGALAFTEVAGSALAAAGAVRGAAWADFNGDGASDVYVTRAGQSNQLFLNDGTGVFTAVSAFGDTDTGQSGGAAFVDFDNDGLLDVAFGNMGTANVLLDSQGEIAPGLVLFSTVAGNFASTAATTCIAWGDGNLDGRLDPFVANSFAANLMFESTALGFSDVAASQGMNNLGDSRGAAWGDYDNDGDLDLYLANDGQADVLYACTGPFQYNTIGGTNLGDRGRGRGVAWLDLDNDGNLDLYVVRRDQPDLVLMGDGAGGFVRVPVGPDEATTAGNAVAVGDVDNDGRLDLAISREGAANLLLRNEFTTGNHWVRFDLAGSGTNTDAIGARVVVTAGGVSRTRLVSPGSAYLACSAPEPHFGLGSATVVDQVDIHWPSGLHQTFGPVPVDRVLSVVEGLEPSPAPDEGGLPRLTSLGQAVPNPFNPSTTIRFSLDRPAHATVTVYAVDGRPVRTLAAADYPAGHHAVTWQGTDAGGRPVASGTYLYRLVTDAGFTATGRMTLVK